MTTFLEDLRNERRRDAGRRILFGFLGIFLILFGSVVLLNAPIFQVKDIFVSGSEFLSDEIAQFVRQELKSRTFLIFPHANMFFVPETQIGRDIQVRFSEIEYVRITGSFLGAVEVEVVEREPWLVVCKNNDVGCFYVSRDGIVYDESPNFSGSVLVKVFDMREEDLYRGARFLSDKKLRAFAKIYDQFENYGFARIAEVNVLKYDRMEVITALQEGGWKAIFDLRVDANEMLENLRTAITVQIKDRKKDLDYIDLRFGNKLFFKFK